MLHPGLRRWRESRGMRFTISQNRILERLYDLAYRFVLMAGNAIERLPAHRRAIVNMQRLIKIVLGNMVEMGNDADRHPRTNGGYFPRFDGAGLLLKALHRLNGIRGCKSNGYQHEEQEETEETEPGALAQFVQLLAVLSFIVQGGLLVGAHILQLQSLHCNYSPIFLIRNTHRDCLTKCHRLLAVYTRSWHACKGLAHPLDGHITLTWPPSNANRKRAPHIIDAPGGTRPATCTGQMDKGQMDKGQMNKGQMDKSKMDKGQMEIRQIEKGQMDKGQMDKGQMDKGQMDKGQMDKGQGKPGLYIPQAPNLCFGCPLTFVFRRNRSPESGYCSFFCSLRPVHALVMYNSSRFGPPKTQLVVRSAGTCTTRSIVPSGA